MTDLDTLTAMFDRAGITYSRETVNDIVVVTLSAKSAGVGGYSGFCAEIYFSPDGLLREVALYE